MSAFACIRANAAESVSFAEPKDTVITVADLADLVIIEAERHLGKPYKYGARGPKSFDCSGFTSYVYNKFGYTLGRSSRDQALDGVEVTGDLSDLQKGDIVIFAGRKKGSIGHVGIFVDLDKAKGTARFIHADRGGVRYSYFTEPYYETRVMGVRRILPDFIAANDRKVGDYPYDTDGDVTIGPDLLELGAGDSRVVLFEGGRWALVASDGTLSVPAASSLDRIVIYPDGTWKVIPHSTVKLPTLSVKSATESTTKTTSVTSSTAAAAASTTSSAAFAADSSAVSAASDTTSAPTVQEPEPVYHKVVKGDTLYGISKKYGVSVKTLCRLNGITESTTLSLGRRLRVK